jgi:glucan 1,3-beta-glucosidase
MLMTDPVNTATITLNSNQIALLPTFTRTGTPVTLTHAAMPTNVDPGNGWTNAQDTAGAYATVSGCTYPK